MKIEEIGERGKREDYPCVKWMLLVLKVVDPFATT